MDVKLVLQLAGLGITPLSTATDNERGWAENSFKLGARLLRVCVAFNRERQPFGNVLFGGAAAVMKSRDRRTEDNGLSGVGRLPCHAFGNVDQFDELAVDLAGDNLERLAAILVKRSQRDGAAVGVAE
jgi:hypothetical protein